LILSKTPSLSGRAVAGDLTGRWPLQLVLSFLPYKRLYQVAVVLGRGKLAKIEVALSKSEECQVKLLGEQRAKKGRVAA